MTKARGTPPRTPAGAQNTRERVTKARGTTLTPAARTRTHGSARDQSPSARGQITLLPIASPRRTWRAAAELLRPRKAQTALTLATLLASGIAVVFVPALLGELVDAHPRSRRPLGRQPDRLGLFVALMARAAFTGLGQLLLGRLGEQVLAQLRERVIRRALDTPLETVERAGTGDLVQRTGGDITVVSEGIRSALPGPVDGPDRRGPDLGRADRARLASGTGRIGPAADLILATRWYLRTSGPRYAPSERPTAPRPRVWSAA